MKKTLLVLSLISISFLNAQLDKGMVAKFNFDENLSDVSQSSIQTSINGSVKLGLDRFSVQNSAVVLGNGNYISFNNKAVKIQFPITISVWVNFNDFGDNSVIFSSDNVLQNYYGYWLNVIKSGQVAINFGAGLGGSSPENRRTYLTDQQLTLGNWHHVVATIRSFDDMSIYIDCQNSPGEYSGTGSTNIRYSKTDSRIGNGALQYVIPNGLFLDGSIDQLTIWNRDFSETEISSFCAYSTVLESPDDFEHPEKAPKQVVKIINSLGQEIEVIKNSPLLYIYNDGSTEKVILSK